MGDSGEMGEALREVLNTYDNREVDAEWLSTFCCELSGLQFRVDRVLFVCEVGRWGAYLVEHRNGQRSKHKLVEVDYRFEVANLLRGLKVDKTSGL